VVAGALLAVDDDGRAALLALNLDGLTGDFLVGDRVLGLARLARDLHCDGCLPGWELGIGEPRLHAPGGTKPRDLPRTTVGYRARSISIKVSATLRFHGFRASLVATGSASGPFNSTRPGPWRLFRSTSLPAGIGRRTSGRSSLSASGGAVSERREQGQAPDR